MLFSKHIWNIAKAKKSIEEKLDWHNNEEFNGGKSANQSYKNDGWHIDDGWRARNKGKMRRLIGAKLDEVADNAKETAKEVVTTAEETVGSTIKDGSQKVRNKWTKTIIGSGVAIAALGTAAYAYIKHNKNSDKKEAAGNNKPETPTPQVSNAKKIDSVA